MSHACIIVGKPVEEVFNCQVLSHTSSTNGCSLPDPFTCVKGIHALLSNKLPEPRLGSEDVAARIPGRGGGVRAEQLLHAGEDLMQHSRLRQIRHPKMRTVRDVEADAGCNQDVLLLEQIEREALIVEGG